MLMPKTAWAKRMGHLRSGRKGFENNGWKNGNSKGASIATRSFPKRHLFLQPLSTSRRGPATTPSPQIHQSPPHNPCAHLRYPTVQRRAFNTSLRTASCHRFGICRRPPRPRITTTTESLSPPSSSAAAGANHPLGPPKSDLL
ncbi:hypothetical protein E2542_SST22645 [Spatholobus suberectus]|nr:hypothetical protein E2542_SST22645 [Spatholobus suberectus]